MPATSQQQQKLFGLALAFKRGEVPASEVSDEIKAIADRMSEKDIEDFAATKHKGLPKMKEQLRKIVRQTMRESVLSENESVNEIQYKDAVAKFNDELIKHPMVKKAAQHYKKTPAEIVKVLQQRLSTKGNRSGDTKEVSIDFKDTDSGITVKHKKSFNESTLTESASKEAVGISVFTGTRADAVDAFINKHNLDAMKLYKSIKSANLQGRLNFVSALVGKDGNPNQRLTIKLHQKNESVNEGSNAKTNYYYLNKNIDNVLDKISDDITFNIDDLMGHDYYEKVSKKYSDEIWKLAYYHPIHDNWQPKDQAKKVEVELDSMISTIEKDLNKKINKLVSDLKKGANDVKKEIKISLQEK